MCVQDGSVDSSTRDVGMIMRLRAVRQDESARSEEHALSCQSHVAGPFDAALSHISNVISPKFFFSRTSRLSYTETLSKNLIRD